MRGHAYGAGLQLALACDFRIFAEGTSVGLPETRFGLLPDMGATVRLPRIVGERRQAGDRRSMASQPAGKLPTGFRSAAPLPEIRRLQRSPPGHGRRQAPTLARALTPQREACTTSAASGSRPISAVTLVVSVTDRNPALLARQIAAVGILTSGRRSASPDHTYSTGGYVEDIQSQNWPIWADRPKAPGHLTSVPT